MRLNVEPSLERADYAFSWRIRVRFAETDAMGIVHHANYLLYLEEARVEYLRSIGKPYTEMRKDGIDHAVLESFVQYRQPLRFDDQVDVHLVVASASRVTFQIAYLMTVGDQIHATAATAHGAINPEGRPVRLPSWLAEMARPSPASAPDRA